MVILHGVMIILFLCTILIYTVCEKLMHTVNYNNLTNDRIVRYVIFKFFEQRQLTTLPINQLKMSIVNAFNTVCAEK